MSREIENLNQRVLTSAPLDRASLGGLNWDDLRLFLDVSESGSLRATAGRSGLSINTIRSRVSRLERKIGEPLLFRTFDGVKLTPAGDRVKAVAGSMRNAAIADGVENTSYLRVSNELRIGTSEGLGSGWLAPRLLSLQQQFPSITMTLLCDNDLDLDRSSELDIGIAWSAPRDPDLIVAKLASLHFMPFASREYALKHGLPKTAEELLSHRFIEQVSPGIKSQLLDQLVGLERPDGFLPIRTNSSLAIFWAVANSVGIAFMPTDATVLVPKLVPINIPFRLKFDIFYYYHPEAKTCELVRAGVEWLKNCFDPKSFPWFSANFVHPDAFGLSNYDNVVPLFNTLASGY